MRFDLLNPRPPSWAPDVDGLELLRDAVKTYAPSGVWALFSGGHDSLCATHLASQLPEFSGVVHIATGIGIGETRRYVYETCKRFGWPLRLYRPRRDNRYRTFVVKHGFPGPAQHSRMYQRLKERSLRRHIAWARSGRQKILLVSGCRESESRRRMGTAQAVQVRGRTVWVAPCVSWETADQHEYMARHRLPENWVKKILCMSGECLCGAYADRERELGQLRMWFPREAAEILALETQAEAAGVPHRWGEAPPAYVCTDDNQLGLDIATLCYSCELRRIAE